MFVEHPAKKILTGSDLLTDPKNMEIYNQSGYQRYRQMSIDDMLLENRIIFLIGEISYGKAAEVIMKLLYLDNLKRAALSWHGVGRDACPLFLLPGQLRRRIGLCRCNRLRQVS